MDAEKRLSSELPVAAKVRSLVVGEVDGGGRRQRGRRDLVGRSPPTILPRHAEVVLWAS